MSLYLIDLRSFGCNHTNEIHVSTERINFIKNEMLNYENKFVLFALEENWKHEQINNALNIFGITFFQKNCVVIVDVLVDGADRINFYNVIRYDSQLIKVAMDEEINEYNKEINLNTQKFLFLMGKPYKRHRIRALYKLYKNNLLDKCDYSFALHNNYYDITREQLKDISDVEFEEFVNKTQKTLDDINITIGENSYHYFGTPVDKNLYKNTSFSLISETYSNRAPHHWFLSEKFWRTIASHHAFILISDNLTIDYIHNTLNINTFQKFLRINKDCYSNSHNNTSEEVVLENSITNIQHLLNIIHTHKDEIEFQIKRNYNAYRCRVESMRNIINKSLEKYLYITNLPIVEYEPVRELSVEKTIVNHFLFRI